MKKFLTLIVSLVLAVSCFMLPTSALAVKADWTMATGPATLEMTEEGPTLSCTEGRSFAINTADMIDLNNFECTFTVGSSDDSNKVSAAITLNMSRSHAGNNSGAPFLLLYFEDRYTLKMEGQILHTGLLLKPTYAYFSVDTTKPITIRGKIVDANHYSLTVDGDTTSHYTFEIPVNYPFHQQLDGKAFFGFSICGAGEWNEDLPTKYMTIKSVNGKDYTGLPEDAKKPAADDKTEDNTDGTGTIGADNNATNNSINNSDNVTADNNLVLVLIIVVAVMFVIVIAVVVFFIIYVMKQKKKEEERKARARAKKAARLAKEQAEADNSTSEE